VTRNANVRVVIRAVIDGQVSTALLLPGSSEKKASP
jgi:hypothetical protein